MDFLKEASNDEYSSLEALWMKKKILDLSSFYQPTKHSTLVLTKWNIIPIEILVSSFYFTQQPTLRVLSITKQSSPPHIVGKQGQQGILTIPFEGFKTFPKIGTKQRVCLPFRHICREVFAWLQLMTISNIRIILQPCMPSKYFTTTTALSKGGKSASRTLSCARVSWQNRQNTQSKMKEFIARINYVFSGEKMQVCPCPLPARC